MEFFARRPLSGRALALTFAALLGACGRDLPVDVLLVTRTCETAPELDPLSAASKLRFTIYGEGIDPAATQVVAERGDEQATLLEIPPGKDRRIVVEALLDPGDEVLARADTGPLNLETEASRISIAVFLRRVDAFTPTIAKDAPGTCSELVRPRAGHTATLLGDGRVLIAGGYTADAEGRRVYERSTELYDPHTGRFELGPDMGLERAFHTATRVPGTTLTLLAGGQFGERNSTGGAVRLAETFDEATNTLRPLAMVEARTQHAAAPAWGAGRVLLVGGYNPSGVPLRTTEAYDPTKNAFEVGPDLPAPRAQATVLAMGEQGLFVLGGIGDQGLIGRTHLIRTRPGGVFEVAPELNLLLQDPRIAPLAAAVDARRVLVAGGFTSREAGAPYRHSTAALEVVDVVGATSARATSGLAARRGDGSAVALADGSVLFLGGAHEEGGTEKPLATADVVAPEQSEDASVRATARGLRDARYLAATVLLADGTVLTTGGIGVERGTGRRVFLRSAEVFQPRYQASRTSPFR